MADGRAGTTSLLRPAPPASPTPARGLRLAFARAAERSVGLSAGVLGVAEEVGPLDDLLSRLEDGLLLLSLAGDGLPLGLVGIDAEGVAAAVEAQTMGRPSVQAPEPRPATAADLAMTEPLLAAFLAEAREAVAGTALDGWLGAVRPGPRLTGAREAGMALGDGAYRVVRLTIDLRAGPRQALIVLLHRLPPPPEPAQRPGAGWADGLSARVLAAPASVEAVLGRLRLPLDAAEGFAVGQVVPLPGLSVASVRLEALGPGGAPRDLGPARLGQSGGMRAVRLGAGALSELREIAVLPAD